MPAPPTIHSWAHLFLQHLDPAGAPQEGPDEPPCQIPMQSPLTIHSTNTWGAPSAHTCERRHLRHWRRLRQGPCQLTQGRLPWESAHPGNGVVSMFSHLSRVWPFETPQTVVHQTPLSVGFSGEEHWSGLPQQHPAEKLGQPYACPPAGHLFSRTASGCIHPQAPSCFSLSLLTTFLRTSGPGVSGETNPLLSQPRLLQQDPVTNLLLPPVLSLWWNLHKYSWACQIPKSRRGILAMLIRQERAVWGQ